ncbi:MAG: hypothetical protein QXP81_08510 [Nitrososphaerota archaeon]
MRKGGISSPASVALVAVALIAVAVSASVGALRLSPYAAAAPDVRAFLHVQERHGGILAQIELLNLGTDSATVTGLRLLKDGAGATPVWSTSLSLELKPTERKSLEYSIGSLSQGRYVLEVLTDRGPVASGQGWSLSCTTTTEGYQEPVYGWKQVIVGYRDVYETRTRRVWGIVGYDKEPVYETRINRVWGIVGYDKQPIYETRTKRVWDIIGYTKEPVYETRSRQVWTVVNYVRVPVYETRYYWSYEVIGYRSVPVYGWRSYTTYEYRCQPVSYTYYDCGWTLTSSARNWNYYCSPRTYYYSSCNYAPVTRYEYTVVGYRYEPVYNWVQRSYQALVGYEYQPVYGWKTETYQVVVGYRDVLVYGWKTVTEQVLVGYRDVPRYGWITQTYQVLVGYRDVPRYGWVTEYYQVKVGTEPIYDRIWDILRYEERTREVTRCAAA